MTITAVHLSWIQLMFQWIFLKNRHWLEVIHISKLVKKKGEAVLNHGSDYTPQNGKTTYQNTELFHFTILYSVWLITAVKTEQFTQQRRLFYGRE